MGNVIDGPWTIYEPELRKGHNILSLQCEGVDWYLYLDCLEAEYLLEIDEGGFVRKAESEDKAQIVPVNVYTTTTDSIPEDFEPFKYRYVVGEFVLFEPTPEMIVGKNKRIQARMVKRVSEELLVS